MTTSRNNAAAPAREAVTIRFPKELLEEARRYKPEGRSLNEFVVDAVAREARSRRALEALKRIDIVREETFRERGPLSDSVGLIRELREERASRFDR